MSVPKGKRSKSKVEFEMNYFKLADGLDNLVENYFWADLETIQQHKLFIRLRAEAIEKLTDELVFQWRGTVILDHNACDRTIRAMDRHYTELFPPHQEQPKQNRRTLVIQTNKEADTEDLRYIV